MRRGDWLELRDAPNTRGIVKSIYCETKVSMLLSGDHDLSTMPIAELRERWEPIQFAGDPPPFWVKRKAIFIKTNPRPHDEDLYAEIVDAKPGWIAYYAKYGLRSRAPCFFMTGWWEFRKLYEPLKPPSAWDRVLLDLDED